MLILQTWKIGCHLKSEGIQELYYWDFWNFINHIDAHSLNLQIGCYVDVQDVQLKAPIFTLEDIARIKDALAIQGETIIFCI